MTQMQQNKITCTHNFHARTHINYQITLEKSNYLSRPHILINALFLSTVSTYNPTLKPKLISLSPLTVTFSVTVSNCQVILPLVKELDSDVLRLIRIR
jgi:hypothetical protein